MNIIIPTREHFGDLLNALGLNGKGVEIGVEHGHFSKSILTRWGAGQLHLVDPWIPLEDYDDGINASDRENDYRRCLENLKEFLQSDRVVIKRGLSAEIVHDYPDESFDFVYIDANHAESHVYQDMKTWYPKLKPGGLFAGHDYVEGYEWIHVIPAVQRFFSELGCPYNVTCDEYPSWWTIKECDTVSDRNKMSSTTVYRSLVRLLGKLLRKFQMTSSIKDHN
jgi:hypothetical protein